MSSNSRQIHLDALRGIAALVVVNMHFFAAFYPYTVAGAGVGYPLHSEWEKLAFFPPFGLVINGQLAVSLFFILSGYVLSYRYLGEMHPKKQLIRAILKRPLRLGGLVWFSLLLVFCFWYLGLFYNVELSDITGSKAWYGQLWTENFPDLKHLKDFSLALFSNSGSFHNPPLWTIYIELYGSLLIFIYLMFFAQLKCRLLVHLLLIILLYNSLYQGFWIGLLFADIHKNYRWVLKKIKNWRWVVLFFFLMLSAYPYYLSPQGLQESIYRFLPNTGLITGYPMWGACLLFLWVFLSVGVRRWLCLPVLQFLGRISYSLYVLHFIVLGSLAAWIFVLLYPIAGYFMAFLISYAISVVVLLIASYWVTIFIDEPVTKLVNNLITKKTKP